MSTDVSPIESLPGTNECSSAHAHPLRFWLVGFLTAVLLAWVGAKLNAAGSAPVVLLPIGLGATLGLAIVGLAAINHVTCRTRMVTAAITLAIAMALAEHTWLYRDYHQDWWQAPIREPRLALFRTETAPLSPVAYYAREIQYSPQRPLLWAVDAGLVVAAAVTTVVVGRRCSG